MKLLQDECYEEMGSRYQVFMIHWLNDALLQEGIESQETRKAIISQYCFQFSIWHDQYWFQNDTGKKVYPVLNFSSKGPASDLEVEGNEELFMPNDLFAFKDYISGNMAFYFDELEEDISKLPSSFDD